MVAPKCECDCTGLLKPEFTDWYDAELELPYVNHAPGECQCVNDLAQYATDDGARWLCSCCHTFADVRLASGTLTEGGDVQQAPGDSLSGPTGNAGDAQGPSA